MRLSSAKNSEGYDSAENDDGDDRDRDREAHAMTAALTALRLETAAALFGEMPFPMLHDERRWSEFAMDARWTGVDALVRPSGSLTPLRGAKNLRRAWHARPAPCP